MPLTYDPRDPNVLRDPHAVFAQLRKADPVHFSESLSAWILTSYEHVETLVTRASGISADRMPAVTQRLEEPNRSLAEEVLRWLHLWMVFRDPPYHTTIRKHLARVVNPRVARDLRASIAEIVDSLLDEIPDGEPLDLLTDFALRLPGFVVMDLLGVPRESLREVNGWADDMMLFIGSARGVDDKYVRARRGAFSMADLFRDLIVQRRAEPRDDVLSQLVVSEVDGVRLTDDELVASMMMLGNGAQLTTAHLLTNAVIALCQHPDIQTDLREHPDAIETAVEEFLRFDGPVLAVGRIVISDTEFDGKTLHEGDRIFGMLTAANRDPAVFDDADAIDLRRAPNRHLAFSKGPHFCLGAPVARVEVQVALATLLERFDRIELVESLEQIPWTNSLTSRGPVRLPIRLARSAHTSTRAVQTI